MRTRVQGLGCKDQGLGFKDQGLSFREKGLFINSQFRVENSVPPLGFRS